MGMIYRRGNVWWIKFYRNGKPFYESTRSAKKGDAERKLKLREGDIAGGRFTGVKADRVTFEELMGGLVTDYRVNARRSLDHVQRVVRRLTAFFGGRRAVDIMTADVRAYIAMRQAGVKDEEGNVTEAPAANATIQNELAALKRAFNLALQGEMIHHGPYVPGLHVDNARKGFVGDIEYLTLREALPAPLKLVLDFAYRTAWRKREILELTWDRVDLKDGTAHLHTSKNEKGRLIVLTAGLLESLRVQQEQTRELEARTGQRIPWVFHRNGKPIKNMNGAWRTARKQAGLPQLFIHDLRRSGIRNLIRAGVSEKVAMTISGHKTRAVFDRYDIVSEEDLREAARRQEAHISGPASVTDNVTVPAQLRPNAPYSSQHEARQEEGRTP